MNCTHLLASGSLNRDGVCLTLTPIFFRSRCHLRFTDVVCLVVDDVQRAIGGGVEQIDGAFENLAVIPRDAKGDFAPVAAAGYGFLDWGAGGGVLDVLGDGLNYIRDVFVTGGGGGQGV